MSEPQNPPGKTEVPPLQKDEGQHVPWRSKFRSKTESDSRLAGFLELLTSNANNPVKARIPNVFGMCTLRVLGAVASPTLKIKYMAEGKEKTVPKTVSGLETFFYDNWNTISQGFEGRAREEAVRLGLMQVEDVEEGKGKRITDEGSRKK